MTGLLKIEAAMDAVIDRRHKVPDEALAGVADVIEFTWLPGGPIGGGGTLKVAAPDSACQRCQHRMGTHWNVGALCRECGCKGWLAS